MKTNKLYKEESFAQTLWNYVPGIVHFLSVVGFVVVIINFASGLVNGAGSTLDVGDFVDGSPLVREYNQVSGKEDSNITYVVFDDYQCPACRAFNPTKKEVFEAYSDKVRLVSKHNPLDIHIQAKSAGRAVEAAGNQGKYREFGDKIFENQDSLSNDFLENLAVELGLDYDQWEKDWQSRETSKKVDTDQKDLNDLFFPTNSVYGITKPAGEGAGTPTNVVLRDGEVYDWWSGGLSFEQISEILDNAIDGVEREEN